MNFYKNRTLLFTAQVSDRNAAYLVGRVVPATQIHAANAVSTLPVDRSLWHRRFGHLHTGGVEDIIKHDLVKGLELDSSAKPDPICEPCLAGKLHRGPIPKSAVHRSSELLGLIHSDLHGPLPVRSRHHSRYWISFTDNRSRYTFVRWNEAADDGGRPGSTVGTL